MTESGGLNSPTYATQGNGVARRCRVTLLFSDLCDYTTLGELADPEDVAEIREGLMRLATEVVTAHGGRINQFVGDGILAVFGFPEADEQDVRHALQAALELRERSEALDGGGRLPAAYRLRLHSGVHSGLVFASKGDPLHGQFKLTGDAVNTASRLCTAAGPGEVLVSESTLQGLEPYFETSRTVPLLLKGKREPVAASSVLRATEVQTRFDARTRRGLTPFIGRESELSALAWLLEQTRSSGGRVVRLVGDAGIGKTRFLHHFAEQPAGRDVRWLSGTCDSYGGVSPLRPFLQVARTLLPVALDSSLEQQVLSVEQALDSLAVSLRVHLPMFLQLLSVVPWRADVGPPEATQAAVISAVADLVLAAADRRPVTLAIDDWQWADDASTRVLGRLQREIAGRPLLIVVASRSAGPKDTILGDVPTITLCPFNVEESVQAVRSLIGFTPRSELVSELHLRSGGNALFLEELCAALKLSASPLEDLQRVEVPATVHGLIRARFEQLPGDLAHGATVAAVIGSEVPLWLFAAVSGMPEPERLLSALVRQGILSQPQPSGEVWRFRHGLTREVIYETVRLAERRELHGAVARTFEERYQSTDLLPHFEALATHWHHAQEPRRASHYAELAGDKASATAALDGARHYYALALDELDQFPEDPAMRTRWLSIVMKWSAACVYYPSASQVAVLHRASRYARELHDDAALALVEQWTGWLYYALGAHEQAIHHLERALGLSQRSNNTALTAQLLSVMGQSHAAAGNYDEALSYFDRGIGMKRGFGPLRVGGAYALGCRALVHGDRGEFDAAYLQAHEALEAVERLNSPVEASLLALLGMIQLWQGCWQDALKTATRGTATGERVNRPHVLAMCQAVASYASWRLERSATAIDSLRQAVQLLESRDTNLYVSFGLAHLARAELESGELELARMHADRVLALAARGDPLGEPTAHRVLAALAAREGSSSLAASHCEGALAAAARRASPRETALTQLLQGEQVEKDALKQLELLQNAQRTFEALRMSWHAAEAARAIQRAARP